MMNQRKSSPEDTAIDASVSDLIALANALPERINADPEKVEQGLARLVLTVIELLRMCSSIRPFAGWMAAV